MPRQLKLPLSGRPKGNAAQELLPHVLTLLEDFGSSDSFLDYIMDVKEELRDKGLLKGFDEDKVMAELMANPKVQEALKNAVWAVVGGMTYMEDDEA